MGSLAETIKLNRSPVRISWKQLTEVCLVLAVYILFKLLRALSVLE